MLTLYLTSLSICECCDGLTHDFVYLEMCKFLNQHTVTKKWPSTTCNFNYFNLLLKQFFFFFFFEIYFKQFSWAYYIQKRTRLMKNPSLLKYHRHSVRLSFSIFFSNLFVIVPVKFDNIDNPRIKY